MRTFIFGGGGHAAVIASVLDTEVTFLVPDDAHAGQMLVSDFFARIDDFRDAQIYIGIGNNAARREIFKKLAALDVRVANCISRHSFFARSAELGAGVVVLPGCVIGARARLHDNTIVNTLSSVDHDCILGAHSQVAPSVTFCGTVKTGENCFFGVKSAVIPNIMLGRNVTILAGSLVTRNMPDNVTAGGLPARIIKATTTADESR